MSQWGAKCDAVGHLTFPGRLSQPNRRIFLQLVGALPAAAWLSSGCTSSGPRYLTDGESPGAGHRMGTLRFGTDPTLTITMLASYVAASMLFPATPGRAIG
jgi:hypothetical protein